MPVRQSIESKQEGAMTLVERLRHRDRIVHPNSRETFDLVKEAADEIERLNWVEKNHLQGIVGRIFSEARIAELEAKCNQRRDDLKQARDILDERFKRIAELEGALRWEAGEVCENPDGECVVDYPDGPDLWCRYCRIMSVLAGGRDANL
jgi:hypothetical protein